MILYINELEGPKLSENKIDVINVNLIIDKKIREFNLCGLRSSQKIKFTLCT